MKRFIVLLVLLSLVVTGCASTPEMIAQDAKQDCLKIESPKIALSKYASVRLEPLDIDEDIRNEPEKMAKAEELEQKLTRQLGPLLREWPSNNPDHGELVIKPELTHLRIISPGTRMLAGFMAGQSSVSIRLHLVDEKTGKELIAPEITKVTLYGAGQGVNDKNILDYIANIAHQYVLGNV